MVDEFGDYFRTQRWNQGPGSDQPHLKKDIVKAKVAASISHLYERPRVWLEGFYSSGWGTTSAQLTDAIFANYAMGYNLLSLHGLYYATPGSMWEWAPPCNHFRMPYWRTMDKTLEVVERLSYLLPKDIINAMLVCFIPWNPRSQAMEMSHPMSLLEQVNCCIEMEWILIILITLHWGMHV